MRRRRDPNDSTPEIADNRDAAFPDHAGWIETAATITTCRYQFARLNTITLGIPTTRRFRLTYDYYAHGRLYSGEFQADRAIPQNQQLPIRYNPLHPEQNSLAHDPGEPVSNPFILFGVLGSLLLSLLWLAFLRGCS